MAETSLPAVAFVVAYTASGSDTNTAATVAVGLALVLTLARLAKRETPLHAISGLDRRRLRGVHRDPQRPRRELLPAGPAGQRRLRVGVSHLDRGQAPARRGHRRQPRRRGQRVAPRPAARPRLLARDVAVGGAVRAAPARPAAAVPHAQRRRARRREDGDGPAAVRHRDLADLAARAPPSHPGARSPRPDARGCSLRISARRAIRGGSMAAASSATTVWEGELAKGSGVTTPQSEAFPRDRRLAGHRARSAPPARRAPRSCSPRRTLLLLHAALARARARPARRPTRSRRRRPSSSSRARA